MQKEQITFDSIQWVLNNFGITGFLILAILAAFLKLAWSWYNDTKGQRDIQFNLRMEGLRIDNEQRRRIVYDDIIPIMLGYGYGKIQDAIKDEIIRIFDINDRFSNERRTQIPLELRASAQRSMQEVIITLGQFVTTENIKLSKPISDVRYSEIFKDEFWTPILEAIFAEDAKHARTSALNILSNKIQIEFEKSLKTIKNKHQTNNNNKNE